MKAKRKVTVIPAKKDHKRDVVHLEVQRKYRTQLTRDHSKYDRNTSKKETRQEIDRNGQ